MGSSWSQSRFHLFSALGTGRLGVLEGKIKGKRVAVTHLQQTKNVRSKTIFGLAKTTDGQALLKPPQVRQNGAGPKDVKFWEENKNKPAAPAKGKTSKKPATPASDGRYVTVHDYFRTGQSASLPCTIIKLLTLVFQNTISFLITDTLC
jgi:hypothetical protein